VEANKTNPINNGKKDINILPTKIYDFLINIEI
jgi:hypothetical protein